MKTSAQVFLDRTLDLILKLKEYARKEYDKHYHNHGNDDRFEYVKGDAYIGPYFWFNMHCEEHLSFRYSKKLDSLEFFINPIKIHKIMDVELNPIQYYPLWSEPKQTSPMILKLIELAQIGAYYPELIEKFLMENI